MEAERKPILDLPHFPNFMRALFLETQSASNKELIELGEAFEEWLAENKQGKVDESKFKTFTDITPKTVIMRMVEDNIVYQKGYHGAFVLWFLEFVEFVEKNNQQKTTNN